MEPQAPRRNASRTAVVSLATAAIAAVLGFAAIYVTFGRPDNVPVAAGNGASPAKSATAPPPATPPDLPKRAGANAFSKGQMAAFVFGETPKALPEIKFKDAQGRERTLADWRGKVVLLNLWATWCQPCRREMPSLDRLQKELGSDRFEVVAMGMDRKGLEASRKFLHDIKVEHLALYVDTVGRANIQLRAVGLPASILIDAQGREIGRLLGPAEWDGEDAKRLIRAVIQGVAPARPTQ